MRSPATIASLALTLLVYGGGCQVQRQVSTFRVVDAADSRPIYGAKVWMQPWAPVHPFWPAGDKGVTDDKGEVRLSLPAGFWFYFSDVNAPGYALIRDNECLSKIAAREGPAFYGKETTLYMKRVAER